MSILGLYEHAQHSQRLNLAEDGATAVAVTVRPAVATTPSVVTSA